MAIDYRDVPPGNKRHRNASEKCEKKTITRVCALGDTKFFKREHGKNRGFLVDETTQDVLREGAQAVSGRNFRR
jgi:hypothetical protein